MASQHQRQNQLLDPRLGDGEVEEHIVLWLAGSKGLVQRCLGRVDLLMDELAADLMLLG